MKSDYVSCEKIGEGTYGTVYRGYKVTTQRGRFQRGASNMNCAMKFENVSGDSASEIRTLRMLQYTDDTRRRYVVCLLDVVHVKKNIACLIFPLYSCDLMRLYSTTMPRKNDRLSYAQQLLEAVSYIHDRNIIHFDIKPGNVLVDTAKKSLVLADFGEAEIYDKDKLYRTHVVTANTRPPELFVFEREGREKERLGFSVDVYSTGITVCWILKGRCPYELPTRSTEDAEYLESHLRMWGRHPVPITVDVLSDPTWRISTQSLAKRLVVPESVVQMMNPDPRLRPSVKDVTL